MLKLLARGNEGGGELIGKGWKRGGVNQKLEVTNGRHIREGRLVKWDDD